MRDRRGLVEVGLFALRAVFFVAAFGLSCGGAAHAHTCSNGAEVDNSGYCNHFKLYKPPAPSKDDRVVQRVAPSSANSVVRSIGLIVGISRYSSLSGPDADLFPAANDIKNLTKFLSEDQNFDELIVLSDAEATADNIRYYLDAYLPQRGIEFNGKTRLLIAFSGHGVNSVPGRRAAFLLSTARSGNETDPARLFHMQDLKDAVKDLSERHFHVLALINACYGGNVFEGGPTGGNPDVGTNPGTHVFTAGPDDQKVASLGGPSDGSIFFDTIIEGVRTGRADPAYGRLVDLDGRKIQSGGVVRLNPLSTYLTDRIAELNQSSNITLNNKQVLLYEPWLGPAGRSVSRGGFFFLGPTAYDKSLLDAPIAIPPGPRSSIPGRPDLKLFGGSAEYPIHGVDTSVFQGAVDWALLQNSWTTRNGVPLRFVYLRSGSWADPLDPFFRQNWDAAAKAGLDRGAYYKFNFCKSPQAQLADVVAVVPNDPLGLPLAINFEVPVSGSQNAADKNQYTCFSDMALATIQQWVLDLAAGIQKHYGKVPLIYGNRTALNQIVDQRFDKYMIWLAVHRGSPSGDVDLGLKGKNPWTLWQYASSVELDGIPLRPDNRRYWPTAEVFFGDEKQYANFKRGTENAALVAVE